jgi:hypothetical protein
MTKIVNINTGNIIDKADIPTSECTICNCRFSEGEGGLHRGVIGMIPVFFCPTCFKGLFDMVEYFNGEDDDKD